MPAPLRFQESVLMRGTETTYIEFIIKGNFVTVLFMVGRKTYIVTQNQCYQVPIVEGTGSQTSHLCNIYSAPNQQKPIHNL